jgi:hypothetical protein
MLTTAQKRQFAEDGYLKVSGVVPLVMVEQARRVINHSVGHVGKGEDDPSKNRNGQLGDDIRNTSVISDLFNKTPIIRIAESLMGEGNVLPIGSGQIALRYPSSPEGDVAEPRGHLDGLGNGSNGMSKGVYRRGFTAFGVIYLDDVPEPYSGNFTVWPKSHTCFEDYFKREGHEVLAEGMPRFELPEPPVMVTGRAGDFILAHHLMVHTGGPNASPNVRYATIARLKHKDCDENGVGVYTDIWREWPGVTDVLSEALIA